MFAETIVAENSSDKVEKMPARRGFAMDVLAARPR
jgi:hypothetical protein